MQKLSGLALSLALNHHVLLHFRKCTTCECGGSESSAEAELSRWTEWDPCKDGGMGEEWGLAGGEGEDLTTV